MPKEIVPGYGTLLADIKQRVRAAQYAALKAANTEVVRSVLGYWADDNFSAGGGYLGKSCCRALVSGFTAGIPRRPWAFSFQPLENARFIHDLL